MAWSLRPCPQAKCFARRGSKQLAMGLGPFGGISADRKSGRSLSFLAECPLGDPEARLAAPRLILKAGAMARA